MPASLRFSFNPVASYTCGAILMLDSAALRTILRAKMMTTLVLSRL